MELDMHDLHEQYLWYNRSFLTNLKHALQLQEGYDPEIAKIEHRLHLLNNIIHISPPIDEMSMEHRVDLDQLIQDTDYCKNMIQHALTDETIGISGIIIARDEERAISRCIDSLLDEVDEVIVVDTGSTDRTVQIVESYPEEKVKLFQIEWNDDFAAARNYGISRASYDWLFFIDSDEWVIKQEHSVKELIYLFNQFPIKNRLTLCPSIINSPDHTSIGVKRIFLKSAGLTFDGAIHEYPRKPDGDANLQSISIDLKLQHDGYDEEIYHSKNKLERNVNLLEKMAAREPDNPRWLYFLARDGFYLLPKERLEQLIYKGIELYQKLDVNEDQDFTESLIDLLLQLKFYQQQYKDVYKAAAHLNDYRPGNSNSFFFGSLSQVFEQETKLKKLLDDTIAYRENHKEPQFGMLHPNGEHIDLLIGVLLFEVGMYKKAFQYFDFLAPTFEQHPIYRHYQMKIHNMIEAIKDL